jgi:hypothetical protein
MESGLLLISPKFVPLCSWLRTTICIPLLANAFCCCAHIPTGYPCVWMYHGPCRSLLSWYRAIERSGRSEDIKAIKAAVRRSALFDCRLWITVAATQLFVSKQSCDYLTELLRDISCHFMKNSVSYTTAVTKICVVNKAEVCVYTRKKMLSVVFFIWCIRHRYWRRWDRTPACFKSFPSRTHFECLKT